MKVTTFETDAFNFVCNQKQQKVLSQNANPRKFVQPVFSFSSSSLHSICVPVFAASVACEVSLPSQPPLAPRYQSFMYSLISWSRSSLGLAPCGRELRCQLAPLSQHGTRPGYTPTHTVEKSTCWTMNKHTLWEHSTRPPGLIHIKSTVSYISKHHPDDSLPF